MGEPLDLRAVEWRQHTRSRTEANEDVAALLAALRATRAALEAALDLLDASNARLSGKIGDWGAVLAQVRDAP